MAAGPGTEASGGKLSLKRRREGGHDHGGPAAFSTQGVSWFENHELSDAETTWTTLLRGALDLQRSCSSLEKFAASLPEFLPKSSQIANPQPKPVNNGMKGSQWVPFPVFRREDNKATNSRNHQSSSTETVTLIRENQEDEAFDVISLVPEPKSQTVTKDTK